MALPASRWHEEQERDDQRPRLQLVVPRDDLPLVSVRTCAGCGEYAAFVRDPVDVSWYSCSVCGRYA